MYLIPSVFKQLAERTVNSRSSTAHNNLGSTEGLDEADSVGATEFLISTNEFN